MRQDIEEEDEQESYFRWLEENPNAGLTANDEEDDKDAYYDDDGNLIIPEKKKVRSRSQIFSLISSLYWYKSYSDYRSSTGR